MARKDRRPPGAVSKFERHRTIIHSSGFKKVDYTALDEYLKSCELDEHRAQYYSYDHGTERVVARDEAGVYEMEVSENGVRGFIEPGDVVIALIDGSRDANGLPKDVPLAGCRYVVHSFYIAPYGMGVVLNNIDDTPMDNYPYRGYVFTKLGTRNNPTPRIFFKKDDEYA